MPIGRGALEFNDENWVVPKAGMFHEVHPGAQELVVRVLRACGVTVTLAHDGEPVPWPLSTNYEVEIESLEHAGRTPFAAYSNATTFSVQLSSPGRYRLKLSPIPGFAPLDPIEIEISDARTAWAAGFHRFVRARREPDRQPAMRAFFHARIRFSESVRGPLALGYASHFGLGLFIPNDAKSRRNPA